MVKTVIIFKKGMEAMLQEALKKRDFSEDAAILAKAAMIIRNDAFDHQCPSLMVLSYQNVRRTHFPQALSLLFL